MSATWLTVAAVADEIDVSMRTVQRWIADGELVAVRLPGGRIRISQTAWSAFLAARTTGSSRHSLALVSEEER